jgi:hypothetical protein
MTIWLIQTKDSNPRSERVGLREPWRSLSHSKGFINIPMSSPKNTENTAVYALEIDRTPIGRWVSPGTSRTSKWARRIPWTNSSKAPGPMYPGGISRILSSSEVEPNRLDTMLLLSFGIRTPSCWSCFFRVMISSFSHFLRSHPSFRSQESAHIVQWLRDGFRSFLDQIMGDSHICASFLLDLGRFFCDL